MFEKIPEDRHDRWRLMREFFSKWYSPISEADGISSERISEAEKRLGLNIPAALREWYLLAGDRREWNDDDVFELPEDLILNCLNQLFIFHVGGWYELAYLKGDTLSQIDPPVFYCFAGKQNLPDFLIADSISKFALIIMLVRLQDMCDETTFYTQLSPDDVHKIEAAFTKCDLSINGEDYKADFFEDDNTIIQLSYISYQHLYEAAVTSKSIATMNKNRLFFETVFPQK